jgi:hypothetical protein
MQEVMVLKGEINFPLFFVRSMRLTDDWMTDLRYSCGDVPMQAVRGTLLRE